MKINKLCHPSIFNYTIKRNIYFSYVIEHALMYQKIVLIDDDNILFAKLEREYGLGTLDKEKKKYHLYFNEHKKKKYTHEQIESLTQQLLDICKIEEDIILKDPKMCSLLSFSDDDWEEINPILEEIIE